MTSPTAVGPATGSRNCKVRLKHVGFFTKVCGAWKRSIEVLARLGKPPLNLSNVLNDGHPKKADAHFCSLAPHG